MTLSSQFKLILLTPIFILITHYLVVFAHEYAHSFTAWMLGFMPNPLMIDYGGTSWLNLLLLANIDENVNYPIIFSQGHNLSAALIAFAGPGLGVGILYILSLILLKNKSITRSTMLYYFLFWFNFMAVATFYTYVPIRTFSPRGDIANIVHGTQISPWYIYIILGYLVFYILWHFFAQTLISAYSHLNLTTTSARASLLIINVLLMFGYFGLFGFMSTDPISRFLSGTSLAVIPIIIIACWPTRAWVIHQLQKQKM